MTKISPSRLSGSKAGDRWATLLLHHHHHPSSPYSLACRFHVNIAVYFVQYGPFMTQTTFLDKSMCFRGCRGCRSSCSSRSSCNRCSSCYSSWGCWSWSCSSCSCCRSCWSLHGCHFCPYRDLDVADVKERSQLARGLVFSWLRLGDWRRGRRGRRGRTLLILGLINNCPDNAPEGVASKISEDHDV